MKLTTSFSSLTEPQNARKAPTAASALTNNAELTLPTAAHLQQQVGNQALNCVGNTQRSDPIQARAVLQRLATGPCQHTLLQEPVTLVRARNDQVADRVVQRNIAPALVQSNRGHSIQREENLDELQMQQAPSVLPWSPYFPAFQRETISELKTNQIPAKASSQPIQRKLVALGDCAGFVNLANSIIGVQQEIAVASDGTVTLRSTNVQGPPTREAQVLTKVLAKIINNSKATSVEFIRGETSGKAQHKQVVVGNYQTSQIDLDDLAALGFGIGIGDTSGSNLIHELEEQYRKQVHGEAYPIAHASGIAAQERALGAKLTKEIVVQTSSGLKVTSTFKYPGKKIIEMVWLINADGNITSVTRTKK